MTKLVRVILSATVDPFVGEIKRALGTFTSLTAGIAMGARSVVGFLGDIGNIVSGLKHGFDMLAGSARGLWDTFVRGAIEEERLGTTLKFLTGSAEISADIMERLDDWVVKTATDGGEAQEAILDMAKALRSTDGSVDPNKLFHAMDLLQRLSIATGEKVSDISKMVGRGITGDMEMLARTLGISREQLAKLSPEFAKFMETAQGAQETQLGDVTRMGGEAETVAGDAIKALEELTNGIGVGQEAIAEYASTAGGEIESLQAIWENFTEDIGKELLPIIQEALEKLITFITDHKEDIDKFVSAFGDFAAEGFDKLMEWIDSGEFQQLIDNLGKFSAEQWQVFADAIASIDWKSVADTVNAILSFVSPSTKQWEEMTQEEQNQEVVKKSLGGGLDAIDKALTAANTGGSFTEAIGQWMTENLSNFPGFNKDTDIGKALQDIFKVDVRVSVDDDMKLRAVYDKATDEKIGDFVEGVTGGNKKKVEAR